MGSYQVLAPCVFTSGEAVVHHTRAGGVAEVDDGEAKALVAAGKLKPVKASVSVDGVDQGEPKVVRAAKPKAEA